MTDDLVDLARTIATGAHKGQVDKVGVPYIEHCKAVAERLRPFGPTFEAVGWLHDAIEDSNLDREQLIRLGIPEDLATAAWIVSRNPNEPYDRFIDRVANSRNVHAIMCKLANLDHNLDVTRGAKLTREHRQRYLASREILQAALAKATVPYHFGT